MSKQAEQIESARRRHVAALNTANESLCAVGCASAADLAEVERSFNELQMLVAAARGRK